MFSYPLTLISLISNNSVPSKNFNVWMAKFTLWNQPLPQFANENGWQQSIIRIKLPVEKVHQREDDTPELEIPGVYHHSLCEVITSAFQGRAVKSFHYRLLPTVHPSIFIWKSTILTPSSRNTRRLWNHLCPQGNNINVLLQHSCWAQTQLILPNSVWLHSGQFMHSLATN